MYIPPPFLVVEEVSENSPLRILLVVLQLCCSTRRQVGKKCLIAFLSNSKDVVNAILA